MRSKRPVAFTAEAKQRLITHICIMTIFLVSLIVQIVHVSQTHLVPYDVIIAPTSQAYWIWAFIYLLMIALFIWQFCEQLYASTALDTVVNTFLMAVCVLEAIATYVPTFKDQRSKFFINLQYGLLLLAMSLLVRFRTVHPFVRVTMDIQTAWAIYATAISAFYYVKTAFWISEGSKLSSLEVDKLHESSYAVGLLFVVLLQGALSIVCSSFVFGLVSIWMCSWMSISLATKLPQGDMTHLRLSAGSGILISVGVIIIGAFMFQNLINFEKKKQVEVLLERQNSEAATLFDHMIVEQDDPDISKLASPEPTPVLIRNPSMPHYSTSVLA